MWLTLATQERACDLCAASIAIDEVVCIGNHDEPMHLACAARQHTDQLRTVLREFRVEVPGLAEVIAIVPDLVGEPLVVPVLRQWRMEDALEAWRASESPSTAEAALAMLGAPLPRPAAWNDRYRAQSELARTDTWTDALLLLRSRSTGGVFSFSERKLVDRARSALADGLARVFGRDPVAMLEQIDSALALPRPAPQRDTSSWPTTSFATRCYGVRLGPQRYRIDEDQPGIVFLDGEDWPMLDDEAMDLLVQLELSTIPDVPFGTGTLQLFFAEPMWPGELRLRYDSWEPWSPTTRARLLETPRSDDTAATITGRQVIGYDPVDIGLPSEIAAHFRVLIKTDQQAEPDLDDGVDQMTWIGGFPGWGQGEAHPRCERTGFPCDFVMQFGLEDRVMYVFRSPAFPERFTLISQR